MVWGSIVYGDFGIRIEMEDDIWLYWFVNILFFGRVNDL